MTEVGFSLHGQQLQRPGTSSSLSMKRDAILESRRSELRAYASPPPAASASLSGTLAFSSTASFSSSSSSSISASRATLHGPRPTPQPVHRPFTAPVPVASNYPTALSTFKNPHKPRPAFDIVSNRSSAHGPKASASLPSYDFLLNRSAMIDQKINMLNWNEQKRVEDPSPTASRRAAIGKLYIKQRSNQLPDGTIQWSHPRAAANSSSATPSLVSADIISWTPKSPGALAVGRRATAVAAGQSHAPLMVTGSSFLPSTTAANRSGQQRAERPF